MVPVYLESPHKRSRRTRGKHSSGSIRKTSDTRPRGMTSIDQMVSARPELIPKVTRYLTHARFWSTTVFVDHYSDYCYTQLMRGTSDEETLQSKEANESLSTSHRDRL